ncbi:MAG: response regulator [Deltaproteobacteria bacterium]|nr:response regulator [Deltaproteobacteria bacterium]
MKTGLQFKSFKTRLTFWFLIVALLPMITIIVIVYNQWTQSIKKNAFSKLGAVRDLKVKQVNTWLDERIGDLRTVSEDLKIRDLEKIFNKTERTQNDIKIIGNTRTTLRSYLKNYRDYQEIFIINQLSGKVEVSTDMSKEDIDMSKNLYFTEPMRTKQVYIKDIYYSKTLNKPFMSFSIPIYCSAHGGKHITGIMVVRVDLQLTLHDLLLDRTGMGNTGETLLVNKDVIALNKLRWYDNTSLKLKLRGEPAIQAALGKTGIIEATDYRGEKVLAAYTYIPGTEWGFVSKQDIEEIYAPIQLILREILMLLVISAAVVYIFAFLLARNMVKPLSEMVKVSGRLKEGDLSARNHFKMVDEFGFLARSFDEMADSMAARIFIQQGVSQVGQVMVGAKKMNDFSSEVLKALVKKTGSAFGAFYLRSEEGNRFEHLTSLGVNPELLEPFDVSILEGEFGMALATKKIAHIRDIPEDTVFKFKTFTGTALPKEIITIPIIINDRVMAVICLASLNTYPKDSLKILNQVWQGINTGFSNIFATENTRRIAKELRKKNQILQTQSEELQAQSEELETQSEELQQTSDELQAQNVELELQAQQVKDADRLKSEFLSNMSHELRTPLNSVMALSRVLIIQAKDKLSNEEVNYLEIIERNGQNLLSLINDILDLSRIEAGKMDINPKLFPIGSTVEIIIERLEPVVSEKGIYIHQEFADKLPQIESDEILTHQILQNVIGNAVKFTKEGGVTVSANSDAKKVYIRVEDSGIGISEKYLPHIFDEFRQVDGTASRHYEGTGLGLAIAHKAAKILGCELTVESSAGKGSIFTLSMPVKWPGTASVSKPLALMKAGEIVPKGKTITGKPEASNKILIVEDNEATVIQVRQVLESRGYHVDVARGGQEALDYIKRAIPDGIILDLMMPEVDGFEVLKKLSSNQATTGIPVLILTARDLTREDLNKLSSNNIRQMIQKGDVNSEDLLSVIRSMLEAEPRKQQQTTSAKKLKTILVVEDNPDNLITIKAVLQNKYNVLEATDGEKGLSMTLKERPDLVLLDMALPVMDGFTVVGKIKEDKTAGHIPVIAMTARAMKGNREKTIRAGCDDYVSKPVDPEKILKKIEKWLALEK